MPSLHLFCVVVPEVVGQLCLAAVEQADIIQHLVVRVILRRDPQGSSLDAHVDVFGDQDHGAVGMLLLQRQGGDQDGVIGAGIGQRQRVVAKQLAGLEEEFASDANGGIATQLQVVQR